MRNEPQRTHRHEVASRRVGHKERNKKLRKFGAASQRNGITQNTSQTLIPPCRASCFSLQPFGHPTAGASLSLWEKGRRCANKSGNRKGALASLCLCGSIFRYLCVSPNIYQGVSGNYSGSHFGAIHSEPHPEFEARKHSPLPTHGEGLGMRFKNVVLDANENRYITRK